MKSPEVLACSAMMLLKWLHSSLSSFSWVHSHSLTVELMQASSFPLKLLSW